MRGIMKRIVSICFFICTMAGISACTENRENTEIFSNGKSRIENESQTPETVADTERLRIESYENGGILTVKPEPNGIKDVLELTDENTVDFYYWSDEIAIVGKGEDNHTYYGPVSETKTLYFYDLSRGEIIDQFNTIEGVFVFSAVPWEDGILYTTMPENMDYSDTGQQWQVVYVDHESQQIVDSGMCRTTPMGRYIPWVKMSGETPVYVYENVEGDTQYSCGLKGIALYKDEIIVHSLDIYEGTDKKLMDSNFRSNGDEFCYALELPETTQILYVVRNLKEVLGELLVDPYIGHCEMTDNYFIYVNDPQDGKGWCMVAYDFENDTRVVSRTGKQMYRFRSTGEHFFCVDDYFNLFYGTITSEGITLQTVDMGEEFNNEPLFCYPLNEKEMFIVFMHDDGTDSYWNCQIQF